MSDLKQLIDLQTCHMTQYKNKGIKSKWHIKANGEDDPMELLPSTISDQDMFAIIEFARKYELIAFNAGIEFNKKYTNNFLTEQNKELTSQVESLRSQLTKLIIQSEV